MAAKREGHSKSAAWSQINQHRYHVHILDPVTGIHHQVRVAIADDLSPAASARLFEPEVVRERFNRWPNVISVQEMTSVGMELPNAPEHVKRDDLHERRDHKRRCRG